MRKCFFSPALTSAGMLSVLVLVASVGGAQADPVNLVQNGDFELTTLDRSAEFGSRYPTQQVTGWTTSAAAVVLQSGTADTTGATVEGGRIWRLWGPGDGSANGLPASSPAGGNFIAADSDVHLAPIYQTINNLTVGQAYDVSFYWAAAQEAGNFPAATTDYWQVSLGAEQQSTSKASIAAHGFSGWMQDTMIFTATSTSEVLSFMAQGGPSGEPPFALLDGVSMTAVAADPPSGSGQSVPEPAPWTLLGGALLLMLAVHARQRYQAPEARLPA